jgi:predicted protein tyrosine phosphatase
MSQPSALIHVCPLGHVDAAIDRLSASHLVTLINSSLMITTPAPIPGANHLRIAINDIAEPQVGLTHPQTDHLEALIGFVREWDQTAPLVMHCWAGISRSTAGAFITLCALNPEASEAEIARRIREASATASPNRLMVEIADLMLDRGGRMVRALNGIGPAEPAMEGIPFSLPARL